MRWKNLAYLRLNLNLKATMHNENREGQDLEQHLQWLNGCKPFSFKIISLSIWRSQCWKKVGKYFRLTILIGHMTKFEIKRLFLSNFWPLLKWVVFFEAADALTKLARATISQLSFSKSLTNCMWQRSRLLSAKEAYF